MIGQSHITGDIQLYCRCRSVKVVTFCTALAPSWLCEGGFSYSSYHDSCCYHASLAIGPPNTSKAGVMKNSSLIAPASSHLGMYCVLPSLWWKELGIHQGFDKPRKKKTSWWQNQCRKQWFCGTRHAKPSDDPTRIGIQFHCRVGSRLILPWTVHTHTHLYGCCGLGWHGDGGRQSAYLLDHWLHAGSFMAA